MGRFDRSADGWQVGDVERQSVGAAAGFSSSLGRLGDLGSGSSKQGDASAGLGQGRCRGQADAATPRR